MNKKKILMYVVYFIFVLSITLFASTFAKYVSSVEVGGNVEVGELCLGYRRGDLYRNDVLIIGEEEANAEGVTFVETLNFKPEDKVVYYFNISNYIGNYDLNDVLTGILKYNTVSAKYKITIVSELHLPAYNGGTTLIVPCLVTKEIEAETGTFTAVDLTQIFDLPSYMPNEDGTLNNATLYSQKYKIELEETAQLSELRAADYFGAELIINITVSAVQDEPIKTVTP